MKEKNTQITERDRAILQFINEFGFCEMPHLDKRFGFKKPRNYQVLQRLLKAGLVNHERIFYARHGTFRLSKKGAFYTDLPPLKHIPLGSYHHAVKLIDVSLKLISLYPEAHWLSERRLKQEKFLRRIKKKGHLSDGILVFPDGKQIAIELELTLKGRYRLERILKSYPGQLDIEEVWYYCSDAIFPLLQSMVVENRSRFIKVFPLKGLLA